MLCGACCGAQAGVAFENKVLSLGGVNEHEVSSVSRQIVQLAATKMQLWMYEQPGRVRTTACMHFCVDLWPWLLLTYPEACLPSACKRACSAGCCDWLSPQTPHACRYSCAATGSALRGKFERIRGVWDAAARGLHACERDLAANSFEIYITI